MHVDGHIGLQICNRRWHADGIGGLAGPRAKKTVSLALQGGGAHGASTWGCSMLSSKTVASSLMRSPLRAPVP
jgi:hypothetical protein